MRAVGKARDCLMQRIYSLRKPKTNIQILQQNVLLKCKYLVTFLRLHGREVFTEVRAAYVDTLSRVLSSHFRAYLAAIDRLKVSAGTRCRCMLSGGVWQPSTASGRNTAGWVEEHCTHSTQRRRVCGGFFSVMEVHNLSLAYLDPSQAYLALTDCLKLPGCLLPCRRRLHPSQMWWARRMRQLPPE